MNKTVQRIIKTVVFWSLLTILVFAAGHFTRPLEKETSTWTAYYDLDDQTVDVLLVGSSATYRYWIPYKAYEDEGFTSAMVWAAGQDWRTTPYFVEEALKTQKPDLVVVEVRRLLHMGEMALSSKKTQDKQDEKVDFYTRYNMAGMNLSMTKFRMMRDILGDDSLGKQLETMVPLLGYHGTVLESSLQKYIKRVDFDPFTYTTNLIIPVVKPQEWKEVEEWKDRKMDPKALEYLERTVEICKQQDIPVLFLLCPYMQKPVAQELEATLAAYMEEKGYDYLNLCQKMDELDLKLDTDFYNSGHTNISGSIKVTGYLEQYIKEHYNITTSLNEKQKTYWETGVEAWNQDKISKLNKWEKDLKELEKGENEDESEYESETDS